MALQIQGNGGVVQEVGGTNFRAAHAHIKPLEHNVGHYRVFARINSTAAQVANARLFEIRNSHATNLIIPTKMLVTAIQTAAGTAQENSVDAYRVTGFSVVDTTNTLTPTVSPKRTSMTAAPGNAVVRVLNPNASGMTGGTLTKDGSAFASLPYNVATAINTTTIFQRDFLADRGDEHPFALVQNEGIILENRVLNVTSYGITWYLEFAWAEVASF